MENEISKYILSFDKGVYNDESAIKKVIQTKEGEEPQWAVPNISAIYCLFSTKDNGHGGRSLDKLLYIGKTTASNGFRNRCLQHLDPKRDDYLHNTEDDCPDNLCWYTYAHLDGPSLKKCEAAMIKKFPTALNKNHPSHNSPSQLIISGRFANKMMGSWDVEADLE